MSLTALQANIILPFAILFILAGLYISFRLRFFQISHLFLSLKILSGVLDWKGRIHKLSPFAAIAAGRVFENFAGAAIGAGLAYQIAGPAALYWLYISIIPAMAIEYSLGTLSQRYREKLSLPPQHAINLSGPLYAAARGLRARWVAVILMLCVIIAALLHGAALPVVLSHAMFYPTGGISAITIAIILILITMAIATGGLRRTGIVARNASAIGLTTMMIGLVYLGWLLLQNNLPVLNPADNPSAIQAGPAPGLFTQARLLMIPADLQGAMQILIALGAFWLMAGVAVGKSAAMAGTMRTDHPAKAGMASMATIPVAALVMGTICFVLLYRTGLQTNLLSSMRSALPALWQTEPLLFWLFAIAGLCLIITTIGGWSHTGWMAALFTGKRFSGAFFLILFISAMVTTALWLQTGSNHNDWLITALLLSAALPALASLLIALLLTHQSEHELQRYQKTDQAVGEVTKDLALLLFHVLPKNMISRLFGLLSYIHLPGFIRRPVITAFARAYQINVDEAEGEIEDYPSLNKFFTRALKEGVRLIASDPAAAVSPVDAKLSRFGDIKEGLMIQAKGLQYSVADLLEGSPHAPRFEGGTYCVLYLSPQDYHRIHTPHEGKVISYTYQPGQLFPVNMLAVHGLAGLFPKNERLTSFIDTGRGLVAVVKVGATNVGRIRVTYDDVYTNRWIRLGRNHEYEQPIHLERAAELGRFEMGSTVILVFEKDCFEFLPDLNSDMRVQFGQILGRFKAGSGK